MEYIIVVVRGRSDTHHGRIAERGVAEADLAVREQFWHDREEPCEVYHLAVSAEGTTITENNPHQGDHY